MILGYAEIQEAFVPEDIVVKLPAVKVEGKLYSNRYLVDSHNPHIKVKPHDKPSDRKSVV